MAAVRMATPTIPLCVLSQPSLEHHVRLFRIYFMTIQQMLDAPGAAWRAIINRDSLESFASAFVRDPVLVASVANAALYGVVAIRAFFKASASIYETIAFTAEASVAQRTFLEWKGSALGGKTIEGITVIDHDAAGLIERIELYHRPLSIVLAFANELERRVGEMLGVKLFAHAR
jgi:hypothetical protein